MAVLLDAWTSPDPADHLGLVRDVARRTRRPWWHDRDDILQDGAVGLCRAARRWQPGCGVAWPVYATVAVRRAMRDGAAAMAPGAVLLPLDAPTEDGGTLADLLPDAAAVDPADAACRADLLRRVEAAVAALPPRARAAVLLCCCRGLSRRQAAARMGVSPARVGRDVLRARALVRREISGGGEAGG